MMANRPILIADDSSVDIQAVKYTLESERILNPIIAVSDGRETRAYLAGEGKFVDRRHYPLPVLLLLDLQMPKETGFEVLHWLNARRDLDSIRVLVLTSHGNLARLQQVYRLGADSFLSKPLRAEDLINAVTGLRDVHIRDTNGGRVIENLAIDARESDASTRALRSDSQSS